MCGIYGVWDLHRKFTRNEIENGLHNMGSALLHRGPDQGGYWISDENAVALGHRRLSILDLSDAGKQPMSSHQGRFIVSFNGEIYNFRVLRAQLEDLGARFVSNSDTEVLLTAFEYWGIEKTVQNLVGMFAIVLWDRVKRSLYLFRDRLGEKPLYYGYINGMFLFASELKALVAYPGFHADINRHAFSFYCLHNYIPAPYSIYEGVHKLEPGIIMELTETTFHLPEKKPYWSLENASQSALSDQFDGTMIDAADHLEQLLLRSIGNQMISDVPLGAFLSGGIDSTLVVALMRLVSSNPVKTFTIGFEDERYNEAPYAAAIAKHLSTEHTELYVSPRQAMDVIPLLSTIYDEPFADSSQIPTYLVSRLAREHVTVSLSGDGGDELFGGYGRYHRTAMLWRKVNKFPYLVRQTAAGVMQTIPRGKATDRRQLGVQLLERVHYLSSLISHQSFEDFYYGLLSQSGFRKNIVSKDYQLSTKFLADYPRERLVNPYRKMMFLDSEIYLPDDILVKVDRAGMAVSLESRIPMLDHRIVEFAWRLPVEFLVTNGNGKRILREILNRYVPSSMFERPKKGFSVPVGQWIKGPLREWADELLSVQSLECHGLYDVSCVRNLWNQHLEGKRDSTKTLWGILMFQSWYKSYIK